MWLMTLQLLVNGNSFELLPDIGNMHVQAAEIFMSKSDVMEPFCFDSDHKSIQTSKTKYNTVDIKNNI